MHTSKRHYPKPKKSGRRSRLTQAYRSLQTGRDSKGRPLSNWRRREYEIMLRANGVRLPDDSKPTPRRRRPRANKGLLQLLLGASLFAGSSDQPPLMP